MKRTISIVGLALPAVAVVFFALVYSVRPNQASSTAESKGAEAKQAQRTSSTPANPSELQEVALPRSTGGNQKRALEAAAEVNLTGKETLRKRVIEDVTREVQTVYSLMIEELGLTPKQEDALLSLLLEYRIASLEPPYGHGTAIDEHELANRIAAIIGDAKLQQFLALKRNVAAYGEVQRISSIFQQNGAPFNERQRAGFLKIIAESQDQYLKLPVSDGEHDPIERVEQRVTLLDEYQRHVLELAPSVLSPEQVRYLFEQYQYLSYERANALELQKENRLHDPESPVGWYPGWR